MPTSTIDGQRYLSETRQLVDRILDQYLPSPDVEPKTLHTAMRYSVMAGGKRLRPCLALASYEFCGGDKAKNKGMWYARDRLLQDFAALNSVEMQLWDT